MQVEEVHRVGLLTGRSAAAGELAEEEQLVDVQQSRRVAVCRIVLIDQGGEFDRLAR